MKNLEKENSLNFEVVDLSQVRGGIGGHSGCGITNGCCTGESSGCGITNGKCTTTTAAE